MLMAAPTADPLQAAYATTVQRAQKVHELVEQAAQGQVYPALPARSLRMSNGGTVDLAQLTVAHELRAVAQQISLASSLGMRRQVFMVVMDGFDTHGAQLSDQPRLMAGASLAIRYFIDEMERIGMGRAVTLFTASEFGRTLSSNGAGSDHGWGSHHVVAGAAVRGGDIHGRFPDVVINGAQDIGSGRLLPSTSVTEYGATLARWLGVPASDIPGVFPFLPEFSNPFGNWL